MKTLCPSQIISIEDELVKSMLDTNMWKYGNAQELNTLLLKSHMKGYTSGRYTIKLTKLQRRVAGCLYKLCIYWTPYNPDYVVHEGRVNTYKELMDILQKLNSDLTDTSRIL